MNARGFLERLTEALPTAWSPGAPQTWAQWSTHMVERLHALAAGAHMSCVCQHAHAPTLGQPERTREVLFDFCWYTGSSDYALPAVVIEHENSSQERDFLYDLWKLMVARTPLRVMIGYTLTPNQRTARLAAINRIAAESHWSFPDETEDLILIGTNSMPTPQAFGVYLRPAGVTQFRYLGDLGTPIVPPGPIELFDDALAWLRANLTVLAPYNERDVVCSLQRHIARRIANERLPYQVFNDYPILSREGQRRHLSADLAIRRAGQINKWPVELAVEVKYEPDHQRSGIDIPREKFDVTDWQSILKDGEWIDEMVATGNTSTALAVLIDAGDYHHRRHPEAPDGWRWEAWANNAWMLGRQLLIEPSGAEPITHLPPNMRGED